jgi:hypothetical protein
MMDMTTEIFKIIKGKNEDAPELRNYINSLDELPLSEDFDGGRRYYGFPKIGMNMVFDEGLLKTIQLFNHGVEEDTDCYQGQLPHSLNFSDSRELVLKKLGSADKFREGVDDPRPFVFMYPWCKYFFEGYSLHITFEMDNSKIRMVALA